MQYNYDFEIMSLVIFAVISGHFLLIRQFPTVKSKVFGRLLGVCLGECIANILSCIGLANAAIVPLIWNELFTFAFFALEGAASYLMFRYMEEVCSFSGVAGRMIKYMGKVPFFFFEIMLLATPWMGFFFYFKDGSYYQGNFAWFGYVYIGYYFFMNLLLIFLGRARIETRIKVIVILYSIVAVLMVVLQYERKEMLLTSAANMLFILMIYMAMQNPSAYIDSETGTSDEKAFLIQMKNVTEQSGKKVFLVVHIRQMHHIEMLLGYENSRRLLAEVGHYLTALCGKFCVFRNAEDTFTILLDEGKEEHIKGQIKKRFEQDFHVSGNSISLNEVMITLHYPRDFCSLAEYRALYGYLLEAAQNSGKQVFFEVDEAVKKDYYRRNKVEQAVDRAITENRFEVYYQPIYSLKEKCVVSLEALVRLKDEKLGAIPPDEFIPLAEQNGTITQISEIVLEECCRFLAKHVLPNPSLGIRTIHVNIAAAQCLNRNLKESILPVLERYYVPAHMITLELTERTAVEAPKLMLWHMQEFGKIGMGFAMDDYGSGNSNCSYLIRFPFREIKIDKNMTWSYFENPTAKIVIENEIKTIQKLGLPLIMEGVEKKEQNDALEALGVDMIQGYYYGKPMPETECLRYIRRMHFAKEEYGKS